MIPTTSLEELRRRRNSAMSAAREWALSAQGESYAVQQALTAFWLRIARKDNHDLIRAKRSSRGAA